MGKHPGKRFLSIFLAAILFFQTGPVWAELQKPDGGAPIHAQCFPDDAFRAYVAGACDKDQNGFLDQGEMEEVRELDVSGLGIESLEGLGFFPNLIFLNCEDNELTKLDLRENARLERVRCRKNALFVIDARECLKLREVDGDPDVAIRRSLGGQDQVEAPGNEELEEEIPGEEIPEEGTLGSETLGERTPEEGTLGNETLGEEISEEGVLGNEILENDISGNTVSKNSASGNEISGNGISENAVSKNSVSENGISENAVSKNSVSENTVSKNEISLNEIPENVVSENQMPEGRAAQNVVSGGDENPAPTQSQQTVYKVTFQSKGGSAVKAQNVVKGAKAKKPSNPTRAKYKFAGWYNGKTKYDFSKPVTRNLTLQAKWTKVMVGAGKLRSLSNSSRGVLKVRLGKVKGAEGYQVQVSADKKFQTKKESFFTKKTELTVRDRYKNKRYYVRVRAYKLDSKNAKIYGKFSGKKSLKTTKGIQKVNPSRTAATITSVTLSNKKTVKVQATVKNCVKSVDSYYYLFHLSCVGSSVARNAKPDAKVKKSTKVTMTAPLNYGTSASKLQSRFVLAVKTDKAGAYSVICTPKFISNPEKLASYNYAFPKSATKKGLQVDPYYLSDAVELGVRHTAYNVCLDDLIATPEQENAVQGISYKYNGNVYWFNRGIVESIDNTLNQYKKNGIIVSAIFLLRWRDDISYLIPKAARAPGHGFYALNTSEAKARKHLEAIFTFLAQRYTPDGRIANWILGNEVNNYGTYHYTGSAALANNARIYANAYRLAYIAVRSVYAKARVYISLDQVWTYLVANSHTSKQFLEKFAEYWEAYGDLGDFNIAFHPYPAPLEDPAFWANSRGLVAQNVNSPCISMSNLRVLTDYVKSKWGNGVRIILSEQGFTSQKYGMDAETLQAAAMAYAYYLAEFNSSVDAFILHRHVDHQAEQAIGLHLGLWTNDGGASGNPAAMGRKKYAWEVFKYMDTSKGKSKTKFALAYIGASSWKAAVSGYDSSRFT